MYTDDTSKPDHTSTKPNTYAYLDTYTFSYTFSKPDRDINANTIVHARASSQPLDSDARSAWR